MRKKIAAAALTTALVLTACGNSDEAGGGGSSDGEVTLRMVESLTSPARTTLIRGLLDEFEAEHPNIKVELVSPPTEQADQQIQQMLQAQSGADVLEVRDLTVGPFSNNGWLYDMQGDLVDWDGLDELTDQTHASMYDADGHAYFIPSGFYGLSPIPFS